MNSPILWIALAAAAYYLYTQYGSTSSGSTGGATSGPGTAAPEQTGSGASLPLPSIPSTPLPINPLIPSPLPPTYTNPIASSGVVYVAGSATAPPAPKVSPSGKSLSDIYNYLASQGEYLLINQWYNLVNDYAGTNLTPPGNPYTTAQLEVIWNQNISPQLQSQGIAGLRGLSGSRRGVWAV